LPSDVAVFAVTATARVASLNADALSVTRRVKLAFVAVQLAMTSAVTTPDASIAGLETMTPLTIWLGPPPTVTTNVFSV
jgi:hypothetical protein